MYSYPSHSLRRSNVLPVRYEHLDIQVKLSPLTGHWAHMCFSCEERTSSTYKSKAVSITAR
jgi:hypothetical protein